MGCVCCSLSSFVSIVLDALERISLCTVCAMLTCCLLFTIITVMVLGIGIGYHFCFVSSSADSMATAAQAAGAVRSGPQKSNVMRSVDKAVRRGLAHRLAKRDLDRHAVSNNNTVNEMIKNTTHDFRSYYEHYSEPNLTSPTSLR